VTAVFGATNERAWLGFAGGGVDIVDAAAGRVGSLRPDRARPESTLPERSVRAITGFPHGSRFIGTAAGLYETDRGGSRVRRIAMPGAESDHIDSLRVIDGVLWIGTNTQGVWRLAAGTATPRRLRLADLSSNRITVIAPAAPGHLWVGTYGGLNLVDLRSGKAERITAQGPGPRRRAAGFIASLLTDRRGRLWVGTFGEGIEILDHLGASGRSHFVQLSLGEGLPNINVDSMLADREGRIWVATDDGIATIDQRTLAIHALSRADGVAFSNYYLGARARLADGDMLFGSTDGLTIVRPALAHDWTYAPPIVVTDVRVGGSELPAPYGTLGAAGPPIDISPQANSLSVQFAALDFSAPERNRYAYRLDGFDRVWNETDADRRLAAYTNLPPGTYTLELRGSNRNGVWSAATLAVSIRVLPAWYQTTTFRAVGAVAALALLVGLVQIRTSYLRRRERELRQQVDDRTAELRALATELRANKAELEQMAYRDALTNLPNRRMFGEEFARLLAPGDPGQHRPVVLLLIDLDHFKVINDSLGHDAGDALLIETANRLLRVTRSGDCAARLGGDEFAILLAGEHSVAEVDRICDRIVASLSPPVAFKGAQLQTTASIGIAVSPEDGDTQDALYKSADMALYAAKREGRDMWRRRTIKHA
jgi:diguanylate cyclase (GGDEF)-like protein